MLATGAALILATMLGLWVSYHAARGLRTGVARAARGAQFERAKQPGWYWFTVAGQIAIALGCIYLIARLLGLGPKDAAAAEQAGGQQPELVRLAQGVLVSSLDSTLPPVAFGHWLARLTHGSRDSVRWEVNDCGEGGDGLAAPTCVEALFKLAPDTAAHASLIVAGTEGAPGQPAIWVLYVTAGTSTTTFKALPAWAAYVRRHKQ